MNGTRKLLRSQWTKATTKWETHTRINCCVPIQVPSKVDWIFLRVCVYTFRLNAEIARNSSIFLKEHIVNASRHLPRPSRSLSLRPCLRIARFIFERTEKKNKMIICVFLCSSVGIVYEIKNMCCCYFYFIQNVSLVVAVACGLCLQLIWVHCFT